MSAPMIGELRSRLTLQAPQRAGDDGGGADVTWTDIVSLWGRITPLRGGERAVAGRLAGSVSHEILIRWRTGVEPSMRFNDAGRVLEIHAVMDVGGRRRWLRCLCEERDL